MPKFRNRRLGVFLCHSSRDLSRARELFHRLLTEKWMDVWFIEVSLLPSQDWDFEIRRVVQISDALIVLHSKHSIEKEDTPYPDIAFVSDILRGKLKRSIPIIALRLDDAPLSENLKTRRAMDYFPKSQRDRAYQYLLENLKSRAEQIGVSMEKRDSAPESEEAIQWFPSMWKKIASADIDSGKEILSLDDNQIAQLQPPGRGSSGTILLPSLRWVAVILLALGFLALAINYRMSSQRVDSKTPTITLDGPTPIPQIGSVQVSHIDDMKMVFVPAGEFLMGGDVYFDEKPIHLVRLNSFWIDQTEVTNSMFAAFLNEQRNHEEGGVTWLDATDNSVRIHFGDNAWHADQGYEDHPVVEITWYGANAYCLWAGRRLPSEAEWEKAARWRPSPGGRGQGEGKALVYPWGNQEPTEDLLNFNDNVGDTTKVGSYPDGASPYGALDMAGNAWEWVADRHSRTYYTNSPFDNPRGPETGSFRVLRGGAWNYRETYARSVHRNRGVPIISHHFIGFRCALSE